MTFEKVDPPFGTLFEVGDHLIEMGFARPAPVDEVCSALERMGFIDVVFDQSYGTGAKNAKKDKETKETSTAQDLSEWSPIEEGSGHANWHRLRFVARLARPIRVLNLPEVRWLFARRLSVDPFEDLTFQKLKPFRLMTNRIYELRFWARIRESSRASTAEALRTMGFEPQKLLALKKNKRFPGKPGADGTHWVGVAEWTKGMSYIVRDDPLYFESVVDVSPHAPDEPMSTGDRAPPESPKPETATTLTAPATAE